jgi:hypothetical protein
MGVMETHTHRELCYPAGHACLTGRIISFSTDISCGGAGDLVLINNLIIERQVANAMRCKSISSFDQTHKQKSRMQSSHEAHAAQV